MSKRSIKSNRLVSFPDPTGKEQIDPAVEAPEQVRNAAARADALVTGKPLAPPPLPNGTRREPKVPYTDAEIDEALQYIDSGDLKVTDARVATIIGLAHEGGRLIKAHRRGAQQLRKNSKKVTRRLEALIQAYRELSPHLQKRPTGVTAIMYLRKRIIEKLSLQDKDEVLSEDTIRQDIRLVRPLLRLIEKGIIPRTGSPKRQGISEKTRQEMVAGRTAVARAASANKAQKPLQSTHKDKA